MVIILFNLFEIRQKPSLFLETSHQNSLKKADMRCKRAEECCDYLKKNLVGLSTHGGYVPQVPASTLKVFIGGYIGLYLPDQKIYIKNRYVSKIEQTWAKKVLSHAWKVADIARDV